MQTLLAYRAYLQGRYMPKTARMYWSDVRSLSLHLKDKTLCGITRHDLQEWVGTLKAPAGRHLDPKTVTRKVSAVITYFRWLREQEAITDDPAASLMNLRVQSPLPDYLYEAELRHVYEAASTDPRLYVLVLLFVETGLKSNELARLTRGSVDLSDRYQPQVWVKRPRRHASRDRKVALPPAFTAAYLDYLRSYVIADGLFPFTDRFLQLLFVKLRGDAGITKALTPKTLRHTHVVRAYQRGEDPEHIFDRIGLAPASRKEADEMYSRLAAKGL